MWRSLSKALREVWRLSIPEGGGAYRPEKHYMRGPGPKWQAKYGAHSRISAGKPRNTSHTMLRTN